MQANFEARFDAYLPLLSNRENTCDFLTLLFKRIIHLFKEREWITDQAILNRFQASIQAPSDITKRIHGILLKRLGSNSILDSIAQYFERREASPLRIESPSPNISPKEIGKFPKMEFFNSRFTPILWDYARTVRMFSNLFPDKFLTEDGEKLNAEEKVCLEQLIENCKADNTLENRVALLDWMSEIESNERGIFKEFLDSYLKRILSGDSTEQLKLDLRIIRKYLINRDDYLNRNSGENGGGNSRSVYIPLLEVLQSTKLNPNYRCGEPERMFIKNNRIYIPKRIGPRTWDTSPHWAAGFTIGHNAHATTYVFDGTHYQWLDNGRKPKKMTAEELYHHISNITLNSSWEYYLIPEGKEPTSYPDPSKWSYPAWERNNCFIASSLVLLAMVKFYEDTLIIQKVSSSLFTSELGRM